MKTKPKPNKSVKKQSQSQLKWSIKILILSFALSMFFGVISELFLTGTGIIISVIIILVLVFISIITDMIGVAITAANVQPFRAMASKKIRGSKEAIKLINNADKVSSIIADVVGDVCGILSGAAGASIVIKIALESSSALSIIIASLISAVVASITIFGKSICKKYAMNNCDKIILAVGRVLSWFTSQNKSNAKKDEKQDHDKECKNDNSTNENM